jgi:hypothetical protein
LALSLVVKRPGREAYHSPPSIAKVKESGALCHPHTQIVFMAWCLVKHRDIFTLLLSGYKELIITENIIYVLRSDVTRCEIF